LLGQLERFDLEVCMGVGNPMGMGIAIWLIEGMAMGIMQREWEWHIFNV